MKGILVAIAGAGAVVIGIPFFVIGWVIYIINPKTVQNRQKQTNIWRWYINLSKCTQKHTNINLSKRSYTKLLVAGAGGVGGVISYKWWVVLYRIVVFV